TALRVRVTGEAGIGKTRLLDEFVHTLPEGTVTLRATGFELGRRLPLQPLLDALAGHLRRLDSTAIANIIDGPAALHSDFLFPATGAGPAYRGGEIGRAH